MHDLTPSNTIAFLRRFRLKGGVIRRLMFRNTSATTVSVKLLLTVVDTSTNDKVKLLLVIYDVDEYRFQKRPGISAFAIREVRIASFDRMTFLNFDADASEVAPKPMDFRISDCFVAGRRISWRVINPKN